MRRDEFPSLLWSLLGVVLSDAVEADGGPAPAVEPTVPTEPDPSLVAWLDNQSEGFLLTYDTVHPTNPPDWFDCPEDVS